MKAFVKGMILALFGFSLLPAGVAQASGVGVVCNVSYDSGFYETWIDHSGTWVTSERPGECSTKYPGSDADYWEVPAGLNVGYRINGGPLYHTGIANYARYVAVANGSRVNVNIWR